MRRLALIALGAAAAAVVLSARRRSRGGVPTTNGGPPGGVGDVRRIVGVARERLREQPSI